MEDAEAATRPADAAIVDLGSKAAWRKPSGFACLCGHVLESRLYGGFARGRLVLSCPRFKAGGERTAPIEHRERLRIEVSTGAILATQYHAATKMAESSVHMAGDGRGGKKWQTILCGM